MYNSFVQRIVYKPKTYEKGKTPNVKVNEIPYKTSFFFGGFFLFVGQNEKYYSSQTLFSIILLCQHRHFIQN